MTTTYYPSGEWTGDTVAIVATGPSLTPAVIDEIRALGCRVIVVNDACQLLPEADMLVALDGDWPQAWRDFPGLRVTGIEDMELDALYVGHRFFSVRIHGDTIHIRNSGVEAVRIAGEMGAARILLAGFDVTDRDGFPYDGVAAALAGVVRDLEARRVVVSRMGGDPGPDEPSETA